jgi:Flp pilus assembly protein TadG
MMRLLARMSCQIPGFARARDAITSIEMAMLALPFLTIFFAIIETGYMFFLAILLEGATADAARQIRTGAVQEAGSPLAKFQQILCERMFNVIQCPQGVIIDVRNYSRFEDAVLPAMAASQAGASFVAGNPGDVIVVRVAFSWHFITPFLETLLGQADGGQRTFISSAAFRNEPWGGPIN